jgi:3-deoxy-D-manno-octulosonic-acid transferase
MGLLSSLYRHATLCYIGGGFNPSGIHNTLEAAVHGKPVLFGPNYKKFREAAELTEIGAARSYTEYAELLSHFRNWLDSPESMQDSGRKAATYVRSRTGATSTILETLADRVR